MIPGEIIPAPDAPALDANVGLATVTLDVVNTGDGTDTVDYGALCELVARVLTEERFVLLERLAERIAQEALADVRVHRVEVAVRKLRPPVPQLLATSGVRIVRSR